MKDELIEGYLKDFTEIHDLGELPQSEAFEHFVNYCIVSREHPENFDFEPVRVGGSGDMAMDGIAILVNEHLVSSREDIDFFKKSLRRLDAHFVFIQAKTSDKFDMGDIGNFLYGVKAFFGTDTAPTANAQIRLMRELKDYIYSATIDMDRAPVCDLYFATCGKWVGDATLNERINAGVKELEGTTLFSRVRFNPLDAEAIRTLYRELRRKVVREVVFDKHTILPNIEYVQEAYIGILPCVEYLKLICDSEATCNGASSMTTYATFRGTIL